MHNQYDNIIEALSQLKLNGFTKSLIVDGGRFYCDETDKSYDPKDMLILESHRFEGNTDYNDMSILYAVEAFDGFKGIIIDAFGTYADADLSDLLKQMRTNSELNLNLLKK